MPFDDAVIYQIPITKREEVTGNMDRIYKFKC